MSLMLATGVLKYRETENDPWQPLVLRASMDLNALADEFDSTKSYTRGDYVLKDNELYICKATTIQENTPWASSSWRKTSLAHELIRTQTVYYAEVVSYSGSTECLVTADIINPSNRSIDPMEMNSNGTLLVLSLGTIPSGSTGIFNLSLNITGLSSSWYVYKEDGTTYNISEMNSNSTLLLVFQSNFTYGSNDTVTAKDVGWHMIGDLSASDKVSKAGDTISGRLNLDGVMYIRSEANLQVAASYDTPPSTTKDRYMWLIDENDKGIGYLRTRIYANTGKVETALTARRTVNGSTVQNNLLLSVENDGVISVGFSAPAAWRSGLGLNTYPNFAPDTAIPSNSNLNSYRTAGTFYVQTDAVAATISNMPHSASGTLMVINRGSSNAYCTQIYLSTTNRTIIYVRNYNNASWTGWATISNSINEELTLTRTENDLQNATDFARIKAYRKNGALTLCLNAQFNPNKTTSDFVEIGRISGWSAISVAMQSVPAQSSTYSNITYYVSSDGIIKVYVSGTSLAAFYRTVITVPCS